MSTPPENFDLWKILSETKLVIRSHGRHYLVLSLIFLLPTSFFIIIYPFILQKIFLSSDHHQLFSHFPTIVNLLYIFTVTVLSISGTAPVTYTTIHALCHRPVDLVTSVKSILPSFLPLASSLIIQELILGSFSWPFVKEFLQIYVKHETSNNYYKEDVIFNLFFMILPRVVLFLVLIYLQANWTLSSAVAVCESNSNNKGGLKPLRRSSELVKGKTGVALSMVLLFDLMFATFFSGFYNVCETSSRWGVLLFYMMISLAYMIATLLLNMVANVVLYFYCLQMHGEVPLLYSTLEEVPSPYSSIEEASQGV